MSYSNLLFPGNPRRRRQVEDLYVELCRKAPLINAHTVDQFIDHIKTYMKYQLDFVKEKQYNGFQQTCESLLAQTTTIQEKMRTLEIALKQRLPLNTYGRVECIAEPRVKDSAKMYNHLVVGLWIFTVVMTVVSVLVFGYYISTVIQIEPLTSLLQLLATLVLILAAVCFGVGADVLLSTVIGFCEKYQLRAKIKHYENELAALPAAPVVTP